MKDDFSIKGEVIAALEEIKDPLTEKDLVSAHMVEKVEVSKGVVDITLAVTKEHDRQQRFALEDLVYDRIEAISGVLEVKVKSMTPKGLEKAEAPASTAPSPSAPSSGPASAPASSAIPASEPIAGVGRVIAVASGKGGVGKSTVAVNLALSLQNLGHRVGLLDVDIYGPSLPTLLGVTGRPQVADRRILPLEAQGLRLMSLGFLMDDDTPVIWRGPIVTGIIRQFLRDVDWSGLDYLVVDMPPGTGDAQLALAQTVPVDGALIITTPSDLALIDAARGLEMFKTLNVDVLGIVENMSVFICPSCGHESYIFGKDTVEAEAKRLGTQVLGNIPLDLSVRLSGDEGKPVVVSHPDSDVTKAFADLAAAVVERVGLASAEEVSPAAKKGLFSFLKS